MSRSSAADSHDFEQLVSCYAQQLSALLTENPWAFWTRRWWTFAHWARRDSELQKILARIHGLLHEALRRHSQPGGSGRGATEEYGAKGLDQAYQNRIQHLLHPGPDRLTLDAAIELHDLLDRIMIESGDAQYICSEIEGELLWARGSTTWLTWDVMYKRSIPEAVEAYRSGRTVTPDQLNAARNHLFGFRLARSEDYQVHRARQKMRAKNLRLLALALSPIVLSIAWLLAQRSEGGSAWEVSLVATLGALGAVMSGTIRARDKLVRGSDLRAFRAGLIAQVLLGAASSLVLLLLFASEILVIAGVASPEGRAALGFVAGYSEPFFLEPVARVARMGGESGEAGEGPPPAAKSAANR